MTPAETYAFIRSFPFGCPTKNIPQRTAEKLLTRKAIYETNLRYFCTAETGDG